MLERKFLKSFLSLLCNTNASVLPMAALLFPLLVGVGGLGLDVSHWMEQKRNLQTAVDSAVLAGAWELGRENTDLIEFSAANEAVNNGYNPTIGVLDITFDESEKTVTGSISQEATAFLSKIIGQGNITVTSNATALVDGYSGDYCILSLNPISSGALTTSGSVEIDMPNCGIAVNSSDDEAFKLNGNVYVNVDNVSIVGSYDVSGGSADFQYNEMKTGAPPVVDPYKGTETPVPSSCDYNNYSPSGSDIVLTPGTYCGGIKISGNNNVTFEPGVYIINGGTVDISGNGSIVGEEVSFFLTGEGSDYANIDITGGKEMTFSAPLEGDEMAGFVFFQDPNAPISGVNKLVGNASLIVDGVIYFPSQEINIGGTSSAVADVCTKLVGNYVVVHGTPLIGNSCSDGDADPIGNPIIRLIS